MSFGAGLRSCPGRKMAWVMMAYATARLAQKVQNIEARDDWPWEEAVAFSFFNMHGTKIAMDSVGDELADANEKASSHCALSL